MSDAPASALREIMAFKVRRYMARLIRDLERERAVTALAPLLSDPARDARRLPKRLRKRVLHDIEFALRRLGR